MCWQCVVPENENLQVSPKSTESWHSYNGSLLLYDSESSIMSISDFLQLFNVSCHMTLYKIHLTFKI